MNKSVAPHPFNSGNLGAPEVDSWLFPVRGLAQRRLAFDWNRSCGANENAAGAGDSFFREAVSAPRPAFLSRRGSSPLPPFPSLQPRAYWKMDLARSGHGQTHVPARPTPFERELKRRRLGAAKVPGGRESSGINPKTSKPLTLNPKPQTLNPQTLNPKP